MKSRPIQTGLFLVCFALAGCAYFPWHPFGTPLTAEITAAARVKQAEHHVVVAAQTSVHKFNFAIEQAKLGNILAVDVAVSQGWEAEQLLDQVLGAPRVGEEAEWRDAVLRLVSDSAETREAAQREEKKRFSRVSEVSKQLEDRSASLAEAHSEVTAYAKEKEAVLDRYHKLILVAGIFLAVYFSGQVLAFLAHFNPAFETASNAVNAIISPALHSAASKARKALVAVTQR